MIALQHDRDARFKNHKQWLKNMETTRVARAKADNDWRGAMRNPNATFKGFGCGGFKGKMTNPTKPGRKPFKRGGMGAFHRKPTSAATPATATTKTTTPETESDFG